MGKYIIHNVNMVAKKAIKEVKDFNSIGKAKTYAKTLNTKNAIYTATSVKEYRAESTKDIMGLTKYLEGVK